MRVTHSQNLSPDTSGVLFFWTNLHSIKDFWGFLSNFGLVDLETCEIQNKGEHTDCDIASVTLAVLRVLTHTVCYRYTTVGSAQVRNLTFESIIKQHIYFERLPEVGSVKVRISCSDMLSTFKLA